jgi:hypothetical protein
MCTDSSASGVASGLQPNSKMEDSPLAREVLVTLQFVETGAAPIVARFGSYGFTLTEELGNYTVRS